ncbi:NADPH dehydrogenase NamA [Oceanobacillus manasiensis]|uniref:NADPH dehydrogenase NamA n=1 Tax=Oceanobacillus manasiensis TaxID=586413 RepID=UPI0005AA30CE|nr:NADPH dehydrogenase NamA [Oceanobacillus manasiensis]
MTKLFSPIDFKNVSLKNRIVMAPMCMYSCRDEDGKITPFHVTHYTSRAVGQVGLIMLEATAVQPEGRISPQDLGIWNDEQVEGLTDLNKQIHHYGSKSSIQLAHAGRKAQLDSTIYAPTAKAFSESYKTPKEMSLEDIEETIEAFKNASKRSKQANFDIIELHAAHGYLINQFLSPLTNLREDNYGGSRENRYRFLEEIINAVKQEWDGPLFVRISTDEYADGGNSLNDFLYYASRMRDQGIDLIDCSSGGIVPATISTYPGYQLSRCETIRKEINIQTGAVGLITRGVQAEEIIQNERADLVFLARELLRDPYWPRTAAVELNEKLPAPKQYERGW